MFRAYQGPSSGGTTVCIRQLVLIILFWWVSVFLVGLEQSCKKTNLVHHSFLVHFINFYMFRTYLGPSSGGTTLSVRQLVFIILFWLLSVVLVGLEQSCKETNLAHHSFIVYFINLYMFRAIKTHHQDVQQYVYNSWNLLFRKGVI